MEQARRMQYLDALGIPVYVRREGAGTEVEWISEAHPPEEEKRGQTPLIRGEGVTASAANPLPVGEGVRSAWDELQQQVAACTACPELVANRTQTVFGVGNRLADWLIVGEAPGADEDRQGEPFVGRAGQLLNAMLAAIGLKRESVYIANVLKCRPPGNRDPKPEEAANCERFLLRQIELIQPKVMLSVGRISAQSLLQTDAPVGRLRGRVHPFGEGQIPLVVTYHPAYLLRSPDQKGKAWDDLQLALKTFRSLS
ncbi:MAG: hypothetical protein A2286_05185 [Gammaproteobacteria bacterium RIFOXYA12_FULL_61_12]|nr:MAG: hypothetical protein A2286_05185 [Gammaproteobacteria bacterium RIFOXYA12_FULL_61_12]OGT90019.1 MAG: hypothetical protein A2514_13375 [Gammaproteobacteria bacterium RIFOXYD12_FULL_61_37]